MITKHQVSSAHRVLVTGGSGFLGSHVTRALVACGCDVAVLQRGAALPSRLAGLEGKILSIQGDMIAGTEWHKAAQAFAPSAVLHLAWMGVAGNARNATAQANNISATLQLAEAARSWNVKHFIGAGSQAEYGLLNRLCAEVDPTCPTTLYGHAKLATFQMAQAYCALYKMRFAWLRIFSTYGPQDHENWMIPSLIQALLAGQCPALTKGEQRWDFLHVNDVASAFVTVLLNEKADGVFNVGSGEAPSLAHTIMSIRDLINPALPLGFGQVPYRLDQVMHLQADISRMKKITGWSPAVPLEKGLAETVKWYVDQQPHNL
jgi:UDP-glucose 4-epimerase